MIVVSSDKSSLTTGRDCHEPLMALDTTAMPSPPQPPSSGVYKPHGYRHRTVRPGAAVELCKVRRYRNSIELLICKLPASSVSPVRSLRTFRLADEKNVACGS